MAQRFVDIDFGPEQGGIKRINISAPMNVVNVVDADLPVESKTAAINARWKEVCSILQNTLPHLYSTLNRQKTLHHYHKRYFALCMIVLHQKNTKLHHCQKNI